MTDKHEATLSLEGIDPLPLFGQADGNLRAVEQRFGVDLFSRGGTLKISGAPDSVSLAEQVLRALIERVRSGAAITSEDLEFFFSASDDSGSDLSSPVTGGIVLLGDKKAIKIRSVTQAQYVEAVLGHDVVFGIGPAGTGKTYLAVALAVRMLKEKAVDRIILSRPAVEAGERLGYLPGDLQEKVDPYLRPLYDALHDMISLEKLQRFMQLGVIEIVPLAYMRGRTLSRAFIILDEAQNATLTQMKMFLTRLGLGSKAVITGDVTQVDLDDPKKSGLVRIQPILGKVPSIRFVYFTDRDVVRHQLVREIILAFDRHQE
ncbi:MAG: PhoH family protein [Candidatus Eisenbacteria bacterium]|uniref:PhoH-like protein n=1 Tax=Eiseniibacteriota bacterium TaxID=2212470 RepID=A0A956LVX8_UNCEI|nr:PhoH family protein [Candidatus Eisenbacteria bacterium]